MGNQIGFGGSGGALRTISNLTIFLQSDTYNATNWYSGSGTNENNDSFNLTSSFCIFEFNDGQKRLKLIKK